MTANLKSQRQLSTLATAKHILTILMRSSGSGRAQLAGLGPLSGNKPRGPLMIASAVFVIVLLIGGVYYVRRAGKNAVDVV